MKILLLIVGLALVCGLQGLNNNAQDSPKITGTWFTVGLASNVTFKIEEGGSFRKFVKNITEQDGVLTAAYFRRENGKCIQFSVNAYPGKDGEMHVQYDGENVFTIQSMDSNHLMFILYNTKDGEVTVWGELYGRTPNLPNQTKRKFEKICERFGIKKNQIIDVSKADRCENLK
ncbi:major urinary protein-like [Notamacropus eugenii]|uniref:major urinary protein-like n=1 Tax=Notamacropus eugenii TaxID=9315 RepID=UPI003B67A4B1